MLSTLLWIIIVVILVALVLNLLGIGIPRSGGSVGILFAVLIVLIILVFVL